MPHPRDIVLTPRMAVTVILWFVFGCSCLFLACSILFYFAPDMREKGAVEGALISGILAAITGPAAAILQRRQRQEWSSSTRKVEPSPGVGFVACAALFLGGAVLTGINYSNAVPGGSYLAYPGMILFGFIGCAYWLLRRT